MDRTNHPGQVVAIPSTRTKLPGGHRNRRTIHNPEPTPGGSLPDYQPVPATTSRIFQRVASGHSDRASSPMVPAKPRSNPSTVPRPSDPHDKATSPGPLSATTPAR